MGRREAITDEEIDKIVHELYQEHHLETNDAVEIGLLITGLKRYIDRIENEGHAIFCSRCNVQVYGQVDYGWACLCGSSEVVVRPVKT